MPAKSKATSTNPKDLFGSQKVSFSKIPATARVACALAMMEGARKYGAYNWRDKEVLASIYVDAGDRHRTSWFEGDELDLDSTFHHLGHSMACDAILIDALVHGKLVDDRPGPGDGTFTQMLSQANQQITERLQALANES